MAEADCGRRDEHPLVQLARLAVECFVVQREIMVAPEDLPPECAAQAGVFVSIKKRGELRGCIGTVEATRRNIAEEVIRNAISAAARDPRFPPIRANELASLSYSVDVLTAPERVSGAGELDAHHYGVVVAKGSRRGLLLPNLEGVESVAQQVAIACAKAGILLEEDFELMRFEVRRYKQQGD